MSNHHPGKDISDILHGAGISISEAERQTGVSRVYLTNVINGHKPVRADTAYKIAAWLNTDRNEGYWVIARELIEQQARYDWEHDAPKREAIRLAMNPGAGPLKFPKVVPVVKVTPVAEVVTPEHDEEEIDSSRQYLARINELERDLARFSILAHKLDAENKELRALSKAPAPVSEPATLNADDDDVLKVETLCKRMGRDHEGYAAEFVLTYETVREGGGRYVVTGYPLHGGTMTEVAVSKVSTSHDNRSEMLAELNSDLRRAFEKMTAEDMRRAILLRLSDGSTVSEHDLRQYSPYTAQSARALKMLREAGKIVRASDEEMRATGNVLYRLAKPVAPTPPEGGKETVKATPEATEPAKAPEAPVEAPSEAVQNLPAIFKKRTAQDIRAAVIKALNDAGKPVGWSKLRDVCALDTASLNRAIDQLKENDLIVAVRNMSGSQEKWDVAHQEVSDGKRETMSNVYDRQTMWLSTDKLDYRDYT
jgi:transcriptional regulator with XRE-family HTH domain